MSLKPSVEPAFFQRLFLPLGAFGLALLLWVFVVSENEYSMVFQLPIEARNLSVQKAHREEVPKYAQVRLKGMGRDLFSSYIFRKFAGFKMVLDLEGISKEYEFVLNDYFERYPQKIVLPAKYNLTFVEVIYPNRIQISLDDYEEKTVPVLSDMLIQPQPGHIQVGDIEFEPEVIKIAGPKKDLALINHVKIKKDTLVNIVIPQRGEAELESRGRLIEYSQKQVSYYIDVQEISEIIIPDCPVQVTNKLDGIRVFPSPQTVSLIVIGGLKRIAKLKPEEIDVIIDFNDWTSNKQFYEPTVIVPEDIIEWRDLSPRSLELGVARQAK